MGHLDHGSYASVEGARPGRVPSSHPTDGEALAFLRRYDGAIRWAINAARIMEQDRDDVMQEVRLRIIQRFRKLGPVQTQAAGGTPLSYAVTVARHACYSYLHGRRRRPATAGRACVGEMAVCTMPTPDVMAIRADAAERLHLAVLALPPMSRHVMQQVLRARSLREIAEDLGMPEGTVKCMAHRARVLLRKRLVR